MRNRWALRSALAVLFVAAWTGGAGANPMFVEMCRGMQVPDSFHVQLTYLYAPGMGIKADNLGLTKDGEVVDVTWIGPTGITVNPGSGLDVYQAMQVCDCAVAPGTYEYTFTGMSGGWGCGTLEVTVTNPPPGPEDPPDPIADGADIYPWDIPEGPWPKGVDCVQWCKDNPPVPPNPETTKPEEMTTDEDVVLTQDVAAPQDTGPTMPDMPNVDTVAPKEEILAALDSAADVPLAGQDTGSTVKEEKKKDGGMCAAAADSPSAPPALGLLCLLVALIPVALRSRRRA